MRYIKSTLKYLVFSLLIVGFTITYLQIGAARDEAHRLREDVREVQAERAELIAFELLSVYWG